MKVTTFSPLLLPALVAGRIIHLPQPASTPSISVPTPTASSSPSSDTPIPTPEPLAQNLDLRQLGHGGPVTSSLTPEALDTNVGGTSITVQWVETHIGSSTTWVPVTVTFVFADVPSQGALPGKGVIGMGTLTGEPGAVKTVAAVDAVGGARGRGIGEGRVWRRVVVVAGVLGVGMVV